MNAERLVRESIVVMTVAVLAGGCGGKSQRPASPSGGTQEIAGGTGSAAAPPASQPADPPIVDEDRPETLPKVQASCLPVDASYHWAFGRTGGKLVLCGSGSYGTLFGCWGIDGKGALSARAAAASPGTGVQVASKKRCHEGLCWTPPSKDDRFSDVYIAMHPDGKRAAAIVGGGNVAIYDLASKKATLTFPMHRKPGTVDDNEISNGPSDLWFIGETVFILGRDAGPAAALFPYSVQGKAIGPAYWSVYLGGVAIDEDRLVLNEDALEKLTIFDGRSKGKTIARKLPKSPCTEEDVDPDLSAPGDNYKRGTNKCADYRVKYLIPYRGAQIVTDGVGYIGISEAMELFTLDAKLAEKSRVKLARCKN